MRKSFTKQYLKECLGDQALPFIEKYEIIELKAILQCPWVPIKDKYLLVNNHCGLKWYELTPLFIAMARLVLPAYEKATGCTLMREYVNAVENLRNTDLNQLQMLRAWVHEDPFAYKAFTNHAFVYALKNEQKLLDTLTNFCNAN